jgi:hypothetical protein
LKFTGNQHNSAVIEITVTKNFVPMAITGSLGTSQMMSFHEVAEQVHEADRQILSIICKGD